MSSSTSSYASVYIFSIVFWGNQCPLFYISFVTYLICPITLSLSLSILFPACLEAFVVPALVTAVSGSWDCRWKTSKSNDVNHNQGKYTRVFPRYKIKPSFQYYAKYKRNASGISHESPAHNDQYSYSSFDSLGNSQLNKTTTNVIIVVNFMA